MPILRAMPPAALDRERNGGALPLRVSRGRPPTAESILPIAALPFLSVLPATQDLVGAELQLVERPGREAILRQVLEGLQDDYDYIVVDCPPSLGLLTLNVLAAANAVLIPIQCEYYGLEGISQLLNTVRLVQQNFNPGLADQRRAADHVRLAAESLPAGGGGCQRVFRREGVRDSYPAECPAGRGAELWQADSPLRCPVGGSKSYLAVTQELMRRVENPASVEEAPGPRTTP